MLGDSSYSVVEKKLRSMGFSVSNKLQLEYLKLSHHGSICDLKKSFLELIDCNKYLISTDGKKYNHPDKKTLARIWEYNDNAEFYFNYEKRIKKLFTNNLDDDYKEKCKRYEYLGENDE